jgi:hypothetical protein
MSEMSPRAGASEFGEVEHLQILATHKCGLLRQAALQRHFRSVHDAQSNEEIVYVNDHDVFLSCHSGFQRMEIAQAPFCDLL